MGIWCFLMHRKYLQATQQSHLSIGLDVCVCACVHVCVCVSCSGEKRREEITSIHSVTSELPPRSLLFPYSCKYFCPESGMQRQIPGLEDRMVCFILYKTQLGDSVLHGNPYSPTRQQERLPSQNPSLNG